MPPQPPILTTELVQLMEQHFGPGPIVSPQPGIDIARFGKTIARRVRDRWPASGVFCFNADDLGQLPEILAFFADIDPVFYLGHAGYQPAVGQALHAAGFRLDEWRQAVLYGLPISEPMAPPDGVTIEAVTLDTIEIAAEVTAEANGWDPAWREGAKGKVRRALVNPNITLYLARYHGEPAGIGDLAARHVDPRWCNLGGGAVIPRFRRKGIHTALLRHRLHAASQPRHGYKLVISGADFGSQSFRNQQRLGLRLAYMESTWKRAV
jgi:GNAT superfamily N-acetyltransferase